MDDNNKLKEMIDNLYQIAKDDIELRNKIMNMTEKEKEQYIKQLQNDKEKKKD